MSLFFGLLRINYFDSVSFMLLSVSKSVALYDLNVTRSNFSFVYALAIGPLLYLIVYATYKLLYQRVILRHCALCYKNRIDAVLAV